MTGRVVVIGVGNEFRRDDGAGPRAAALLTGCLPVGTALRLSDGDPVRMLTLWKPDDVVVVIESVHAHPSCPGRLHRLSADRAALTARTGTSSHGLGPGEVVRLAEVLGLLPRRLVIHAVEGVDFAWGTEPSPQVAAALPALAGRVLEEVHRAWRGRHACAEVAERRAARTANAATSGKGAA
ncbi:MAG: hydrogenase maturation protease [Streptomycetaceae bacterium]|nr:hydrogenase maturation protease [Streptomycetaceae bacterium]